MAIDDDLTCKEACCVDMREALEQAMQNQTEIQLVTCAPPPAGNPPNTIGVVVEVREGVFRMELTRGNNGGPPSPTQVPPAREGIFSICNIIGFITPEPEDEVD